jgi:class 3 adenylate cyclase
LASVISRRLTCIVVILSIGIRQSPVEAHGARILCGKRATPGGHHAMTAIPMPQTRGFMFADLRGYTAYVETHGDIAATKLLRIYRDLVRASVEQFDGAEIRTEGDGFYVVFPSASSAVLCGLAILEGASVAVDPVGGNPLRVGIGIHAGETAETGEGPVGSAVNMAARVCSVARPGELLVTETVRSLTRSVLTVDFLPRGQPRLKGITEPVRVWAVNPRPAGRLALPVRGRRPTLAVGLLGLALLVVVLGAIALVAPRLGSTASPGPSEGATPSLTLSGVVTPSPSGGPIASASLAGGFPTVEERTLLDRVPLAIRASCGRASPIAGGSVAIRCPLPLTADAEMVWFERYGTTSELEAGFGEIITARHLPPGDCSRTAQAVGPRRAEDPYPGTLACYADTGKSWIVWTYRDECILGRANRSGSDQAALYDWWAEVGPFLYDGSGCG